MAESESPVRNLCEEATCSICLEYFREPVMVDCGHNFCQSCISECFGEAEEEASCPQCRAKISGQNMKPNRPLANMVEITKKFGLQTPSKGAEAVETPCQKHQEPLKLFCEADQALICVVCDRSREHRGHGVIPKEEALEEYKSEVSKRLKFLREKSKAIVSSKLKEENEHQALLERAETERQKIVTEFKQMHEFLEEEERILLVELKELEDNIKDTGSERIAELTEEIQSVEDLIKTLEEKQKEPTNDFLQDIGATLKRCTTGQSKSPVVHPLKLVEQIQKFSSINDFLKAVTKEFRDSFTAKLQEKGGFRIMREIEIPALHISISQDYYRKKYYGGHSRQDRRQLRVWSYVMGTEDITSGRQSWLVDVIMDRSFWAFGLVGEYFSDGRNFPYISRQRIWALGKLTDGGYSIFTSDDVCLEQSPWTWNIKTSYKLKTKISQLRVWLDYEHGLITFFNVTENTEIFSFKADFDHGEAIYSWHSVGCK